MDQHDFRICTHAKRRSPSPDTARRIDGEVPELLQSIRERTEDPFGEPGRGENLATVRVSGELQSNPRFFRDF